MPRLGIAGQDDDDDIVQGIVLMRRGAQSMPTITRVEAEVDKINSIGILPPGVRIERIYDRSDLINVTTHTVLHNMIAGIVLIFFVQWLFLGDLRGALIVAATIPFALFFADCHHGAARRIGQSAVGGRDRLRPGRRCDGDHGGEHFPASRRSRDGAVRRVRRVHRPRAAGLPASCGRSANAATEVNQRDLLLRRDHHRRLRAAVHH